MSKTPELSLRSEIETLQSRCLWLENIVNYLYKYIPLKSQFHYSPRHQDTGRAKAPRRHVKS